MSWGVYPVGDVHPIERLVRVMTVLSEDEIKSGQARRCRFRVAGDGWLERDARNRRLRIEARVQAVCSVRTPPEPNVGSRLPDGVTRATTPSLAPETTWPPITTLPSEVTASAASLGAARAEHAREHAVRGEARVQLQVGGKPRTRAWRAPP
jgi:hypothetical protein